ncbi:MAG: hypothetical protein HUJ70_03910 [Pseudobutyrivibrio sp.]|mgnify:CR=1 FL=1|nr:hypothetical protein [Pseudobutyrivibrio sp.]
MPYILLSNLTEEAREKLLEAVKEFYNKNTPLFAMKLIPGVMGEDGPDCGYAGTVVAYRVTKPSHTEKDKIRFSKGKLANNDVKEIAEHLLTLRQEGYNLYCGDDNKLLTISDNGQVNISDVVEPEKPNPKDDLWSVWKWCMKLLPQKWIPESWTRKIETFNKRMKDYNKKMNFLKAAASAQRKRDDVPSHTLEVDEGINKELQNELDKHYRIKLDKEIKKTVKDNAKKNFKAVWDGGYDLESEYYVALLLGILADRAWSTHNSGEHRAVIDTVINHLKRKDAEDLQAAAVLHPDEAYKTAADVAKSLENSSRITEPFKKDENGKNTLDYLTMTLRELTARFVVRGTLDTEALYLTELMRHTLRYALEIKKRNPEQFAEWEAALPSDEKDNWILARGAIKMMGVADNAASNYKSIRSSADDVRIKASAAVLTGVLVKEFFGKMDNMERFDELRRFGDPKNSERTVAEYKNFVRNSELHDRFKEDNGPEADKAKAAISQLTTDFQVKRINDAKEGRFLNNILEDTMRLRDNVNNQISAQKQNKPKVVGAKA